MITYRNNIFLKFLVFSVKLIVLIILFLNSDILSASHHNHSTSIGKLNSSTESEKSPPVKKQSKNTQNTVGKKSKSTKVVLIIFVYI